MNNAILIWGAGGHARVVADAAWSSGKRIAGFVDQDPARCGMTAAAGFPPVVMSERELLERLSRGGEDLPPVALGIGDNRTRIAAASHLRERRIVTVVHESAFVSSSAILDEGVVVLAQAAVNANAKLGRAVIINSGAVVEHDCVLGDGVHISPRAVLAGSVKVGIRGWVAAGAVIIPGVVIGEDAVVGAGAVVVRDVPAGMTVVGNPARPLVTRR